MLLSKIFYAGYLSTISDTEKVRMIDLIVENQLETFDVYQADELEFEDNLRTQMEGMFELNSLTIATTFFTVFFMSIFGVIIALIMKKEKV